MAPGMAEQAQQAIRVLHRDTVEKPDEAERCWEIYRSAFAPLACRTPMPHGSYTREQFDQLLLDRDFAKYVAYVGGSLAGLCVITTVLEKVPWVNPDYYRHRYPELYEKGRVFYLPAVVIDPEHQDWRRVGAMLLSESVSSLGEEGVLAVDYSENLRSGLASFVSRALGRDYHQETLERQVYAAYAYSKSDDTA
ncbi:MAG: hypothetical protein R6U88_07450 [Candidatus Bipolaricaulota bacterium]